MSALKNEPTTLLTYFITFQDPVTMFQFNFKALITFVPFLSLHEQGIDIVYPGSFHVQTTNFSE